MSAKTVFYTAIFGDCRDQLQAVTGLGKQVEAVAYVDSVAAPTRDRTGWLLHPPAFQHANPRRRARWHKCMAHQLFPEAHYSVWVDGTMTPHTPAAKLVSRYLRDADICTFRHHARTCVYQEGEVCARLRKDDVPTIRRQLDRYRGEGYPYHNGLAETMVVLRRHNEHTAQFNEDWWAMIEEHSLRDQLSFDYCCWRLELTYNRFWDDCYHQRDFYFKPHH